MAVCRVIKKTNYTSIDNFPMRDNRLSAKELGILVKMLSLPDDWNYTIEGLATLLRDGRDGIRSAIEGLERLHYIRRRQLHKDDGSFGGNEYLIYERPYDEMPLAETPTTGSTMEASTLTDSTLTPMTTPLNTKIPSTKEPIPPKAPSRGRRSVKKAPDHEPEMFAQFWKAYPRGEDKQGAIAEWDKLKPDTELIREILTALERQRATEDWQRRIGIPYAVRWLRRRRWEDEVYVPPKTAAGPSPTRVVDTQEVAEW